MIGSGIYQLRGVIMMEVVVGVLLFGWVVFVLWGTGVEA
jgi:hypothetical protein